MKHTLRNWLIAFIVLFPIINFYIPTSLTNNQKEMAMNASIKYPDDVELIKAVYNKVSDSFTSERRCWQNYYSRNYIISGKTAEAFRGECLPCHIQNNIFQSGLLATGRFDKSQIKTRTVICWEATMFHVYSQVYLKNGTMINVDTWGKYWEVPFGKTIKDTGVCNK